MAEIVFNKDFPTSIQKEVNASLKRFSWLFPCWLQRLYVGYHADDQNSSAYIVVDKDYRFANMKICGHWVSESDDIKSEQILHEIIHLHNAPVKDAALAALETVCGSDERLFNILKRDLTTKNESATSDLAFAIHNKFNER